MNARNVGLLLILSFLSLDKAALLSAQSVTGYLEGVKTAVLCEAGPTTSGILPLPTSFSSSSMAESDKLYRSDKRKYCQAGCKPGWASAEIMVSRGLSPRVLGRKPHTVYVVGLAANTGTTATQLPRSPSAFTIGGVIPPPVPGHIKFFGYFGNAGLSSGNYLNEVHTYNNLAWIQGYELSKLQEAVGYNMKAVLDVTPIFFDVTTWRLHADYQQRWLNYAQQIQSLSQNIAAFYPIDEPYLNAQAKGISSQEILAYLNIVIATIKQTFPTAAVAISFPDLK